VRSPRDGASSTGVSGDTEGDVMTLELEMDELNRHECMPALVAVIRHMYNYNITPTPQVTTTTHITTTATTTHTTTTSDG